MKGFKPPLLTRAPSHPRKVEDVPAEPIPLYLTRQELVTFKTMRAAGKFFIGNVVSCRCGQQIPNSRKFCSIACWKADEQSK